MHESDHAKVVFVCSPDIEAVKLGNEHTEEYLYSTPVDTSALVLQHSGMISTILKNTVHVRVINLYPSFQDFAVEEKTNIVFVRDSFVCLDRGIILCNMKEPVRKKEVSCLQNAMNLHQIPILGNIQQGFLEGGDVFLCGDACFIGIGPRSTLQGALEFVQIPGVQCKKLYVVYPHQPDSDMQRIHLDCIFGIVNKETCVVWEELLDVKTLLSYTRFVDEYERDDEKGRWYRTQSNVHFGTFLQERFQNILPISTGSQQKYGCNILHLSEDMILVQDQESYEKIRGAKYIPFQEVHKMYGGIRCATNVLR